MSFVFGRMTTKIILAHLTRQPFPLWTVMLAPLIGGAVIGNLPLLGFSAVTPNVELWYLRAYFVHQLPDDYAQASSKSEGQWWNYCQWKDP
ncbi:MAG: hypothetical protein L6R37_006788 [Teloschistes peruensis]|nr:MAG: hypothetical protein L6R37_006788 [Teloschistes peruensis]